MTNKKKVKATYKYHDNCYCSTCKYLREIKKDAVKFLKSKDGNYYLKLMKGGL